VGPSSIVSTRGPITMIRVLSYKLRMEEKLKGS